MARDFSGTTQHIIGAGGVGPSFSNKFTVACWAKADSWTTNTYGTIFVPKGLWATDQQGDARIIYRSANADPSFQIRDGAANREAVASGLSTGVWYHLLGTCDDTDGVDLIAFFVDGSSVATAGVAGTVNNHATHNWGIGSYPGGEALGEFDGKVAECSVWDRVLTANEIKSLAVGFSALFFLKDLVFHAPLLGALSPEIDVIGRLSGTVTGATHAGEHPRIFMPSPVHTF